MEINKKWIGREVNNARIEKIKNEFNLNIITAGIASSRFEDDYKSNLDINNFSLTSPFLLPDIDKAIDRILDAIDNEEKVLIYGDYDADGITATSIMYSFFKDQAIEVSYYIPNRLTEGYGLNKNALEDFKKLGYDLVITVDTGIVAFDEAEYAKEIGLDLIITDHHELQDNKIPNAIAVVNPKREEYTNFSNIAGCFVAYKVVCAVAENLGIPEEYTNRYIPTVAIGTIADVMPLIDENRYIVTKGLEQIKNTYNYGIQELIRNIDNITAEQIAFMVVPLLNASGRLGEETAAELLTVDNDLDSKEIYNSLKNLNEKRKQLVIDITNEVVEIIEKNKLYNNNVIIVNGKFHEGVVGIIAAKIVEKYSKPAIILSLEHGIYKGSGRSNETVNLFEVVVPAKHHTLKFGGHDFAVGMSIEKEKIEDFKNEIYKQEVIFKTKELKYDMILNFKMLSTNLINSFNVLEPFGNNNEKPVFLFKNVEVLKIYKREKVVNVMLKQMDQTFYGITFDTKMFDDISEKDNIYILANLTINKYNNNENIQLQILDIKKV